MGRRVNRGGWQGRYIQWNFAIPATLGTRLTGWISKVAGFQSYLINPATHNKLVIWLVYIELLVHVIKENASHDIVTTELFQDLSVSHGKSGGANIQLHASRGLLLQCCEGMWMSRWHVLYQTNLFIFSVMLFLSYTSISSCCFLFCNNV